MKRRCKNLKTQAYIQLEFRPSAGQVFYLNQWWDAAFLRRNFSIAEAPVIEKLGNPTSPNFAPGVQSTEPFSNNKNYRGKHTKKTYDF